MALRKVGKYRHGDSQSDIREEITCYSEYIGYVAQQFADAVCRCGSKVFRLLLDDDEGVAIRQCTACSTEHPIGDSDEYLDGAELGECACPCDAEEFEITVGVSLYEDGEDVYWLYLGCRCLACGLVAVYGDWRNEYQDYRELLARV